MITKKIGVLGSGIVGKTLAQGFLTHGYEVVVGTNNPDKLADWQVKINFRAKLCRLKKRQKQPILLCWL